MADNRSEEQIRFDDLVSDLIQNIDASDFNGTLLEGLEHQTPDFWKYLMDYMYHEYEDQYLDHAPIQQEDFSGQPSFVEFLNDYIDLDNNKNRDVKWSTIWKAIKSNAFDNETGMWNESVNKLGKQFVNAFDANGRIYIKGKEGQPNSVYISIYDIIHANAGNKFTGSLNTNDWVLPNINVDKNTYGQVRGNDKILSVLNDEKELQFTNPINPPGVYSNEEMVEILTKASASALQIFSRYVTTGDPWDETIDQCLVDELQMILDYWKVSLNTYKEGFDNREIFPSSSLSQFLINYAGSFPQRPESHGVFDDYADIPNFVTPDRSSWLRLLMPKYLRKVEVEDLNRNFWVLGQTMSALCSFLFGPEAPFAKLFEDMASEITQLWENVLYLWLAYALSTQKKEITDVHVEIIYLPNTALEPYLKFDNFDQQVVSSIINTNQFWEDMKEKCKHIVASYNDSHVVIIPKIRSINYKHNYYSTECWPGIMYFNRTTNVYNYTKFKTRRGEYGIIINSSLEKYYNRCVALMEDEFNYTFVDAKVILDDDGSGQYNIQPYYLLLRTIPEVKFKYNSSTHTIKGQYFYLRIYDVAGMLYDYSQDISEESTIFSNNLVEAYDIFAYADPDETYREVEAYQVSYGDQKGVSSPLSIEIKNVQKGYYQGEFPSWICAWDAQIMPPPPPDVPPAIYSVEFEPRYMKPSLFYFETAVDLYDAINKYYEDGETDNSQVSAAFKAAYNYRLHNIPSDINVTTPQFQTDINIPNNELGIKTLAQAQQESGWETLNTLWANSVYTYEASQILQNLTRDQYLINEDLPQEQKEQVITRDTYLLYKYAQSLGDQTITNLDGNLIITVTSDGDRATITIRFNIPYDQTIDNLISKQNFDASDISSVINLISPPGITVITDQAEYDKFLSMYQNNDAVISNNYYANGKCILLKGIHDVQLWRHDWTRNPDHTPKDPFGTETLKDRKISYHNEEINYYSNYLDDNNQIQLETWQDYPNTIYPAIYNYNRGVFDISSGAILYQYEDHNIEKQLIIYGSFFDAPYGAARYASYDSEGNYNGWKEEYDVYYLLEEGSRNIMTKDNWICMYIHYSGIRNPYNNTRNSNYPDGKEESEGICDFYSASNFPGCEENNASSHVLIARIGIYFLFPDGRCVYATIDRHKDNGYSERSVSDGSIIEVNKLKTWKIKYFGDFGANNRRIFEDLYNKNNFANINGPTLLNSAAIHEFEEGGTVKRYKFFNYNDPNGYDPVLYPNTTKAGYEGSRTHIYEYPQAEEVSE